METILELTKPMTGKPIPGEQAPDFTMKDICGKPMRLSELKGKRIVLSFFRYAECPLCNYRIAELKRISKHLENENTAFIAVFQSTPESLRTYIADRHQFGFTIVPDEKRQLYKLYRVNPSWWRSLAFLTKEGLRHFAIAWKNGHRPGKIEGKLNQIPAAFLIDEYGVLKTAYYGTKVTDHIPVEEILRFIR